jgi:ketosteroid isomerase-like protein
VGCVTEAHPGEHWAAESEVRATIERFWDGWRRVDIEMVLSTLALAERLTFIGTDRDEYWHGFAALAAPFRTMASAFVEERVSWAPGDPGVSVRDGVAWADGSLVATVLLADGTDVTSDIRATFVLVHDSERWAIIQGHISVAPDSPVAPY